MTVSSPENACYNQPMHIDILQKHDDSNELLAFVHEMIEASYYPAYPREVVGLFLRYHNRDNVISDAANGRIWVAWDDGRIIGTVTVANGELSRMFVSPAARGRGGGAQLAREAIDYACEAGISKLTAWAVPFARGFYEKLGFMLLNADVTNFENTREPAVPYLEMALWPQGEPAVSIGLAEEADLETMLAGQRTAFEEQCRLYSDWEIPPMAEKPEDVARFIASGGVALKASCGRCIIGAVRGKIDTGICHVGRLYVLPEWQGRGLGRRLVAELEEKLQDCAAYSIFTGERSERNLALYQRQGYAPTGRRAPAKAPGLAGNYDLVWLEKPNPWPAILECTGRYPTR